MILGNKKILEEKEKGNIHISPYIKENLQGTSYDVRLDEFFIKYGYEYVPHYYSLELSLYNIAKKELILVDITKNRIIKCPIGLYYFSENTEAVANDIIILPKEHLLASTIEQIGSTCNHITTKIQAKSTWGRHGLEVCSCAGLGDPGYHSHWTLEIYNKNDYAVLLKKGMVLAQIVFQYVDGCDILYKSQYNNNGKIKEFTDEERFEMMKPKSIKIG